MLVPVIQEESRFSRPRPASRQRRFREVVQPHLKAARALARGLTGNAADSEDVVQEASLRALRAIEQFKGSNSRAWFLTIVRHMAYDWMRRQRNSPELSCELTSFEHLPALQIHETPESIACRAQQAEAVHQAVQSLPALFQQTLALRYDADLSYEQIADRTGVPAGTVMSRLWRARRQLLAHLDRPVA
jgi:RNA polymerase sigma-70 factor, ECF subfamily